MIMVSGEEWLSSHSCAAQRRNPQGSVKEVKLVDLKLKSKRNQSIHDIQQNHQTIDVKKSDRIQNHLRAWRKSSTDSSSVSETSQVNSNKIAESNKNNNSSYAQSEIEPDPKNK